VLVAYFNPLKNSYVQGVDEEPPARN